MSLSACSDGAPAQLDVGPGKDTSNDRSVDTRREGHAAGLERIHSTTPAHATAAASAFADGALVQGVLPPAALRHLYLTWSDDLLTLQRYDSDEAAYREAFNERYGTIPSPYEGSTLPAGFAIAENGLVGNDCLLCHAGRLQKRTVIGLSNNRLDLRGFVEDLQRLPDAIRALKARSLPPVYAGLVAAIPDVEIPEPYASLDAPTGAAGANDGFGLGLVTAAFYKEPPDGMETFMGYEDAPAWWTIAYKERLYTDGAGDSRSIYTMMSTLMAFGLTPTEIASYVPTFENIREFMCSLEPPKWEDFELPAPDPELVIQGRDLFESKCVSCHGDHTGGRFPNEVISPNHIGTDSFRAERFTSVEAEFFNDFIPEKRYEMQSNNGYLAPPLVGIWASAPYLHNGSIPTLRALLKPSLRPLRWRRSSEDYNVADLGLMHIVVSEPADSDTIEGRKTYDTTREGLGNEGHDVGPFSDDEVDALLAFLSVL